MGTMTFDRDLLYLVSDAARLTRLRFDQAARCHGMTRAQWLILARVEMHPGLSQNELAAMLEVEPITVARLVDRLEVRGMIERRPDPSDRRIRRLHLLPPALPALQVITKFRNAINEELKMVLDDNTRECVIDALLKIKEYLATSAPGSIKLAAG